MIDTERHPAGAGFYLRLLTRADVTDIYLSWFQDAVVTEYLDARNLTHEAVVTYMEDGHASGLHAMYGIFDAVNDAHIGNCKIGPIVARHNTGGLVTFIGMREYWGRGVARRAVAAGTHLAFHKYGLRKLIDGVASGNQGSLKAYTAAGWRVEATLKGALLINGTVQDRIVITADHPDQLPESGWHAPEFDR